MTPKETALARQDLSSMYLAQYELESISIIIVTIYDASMLLDQSKHHLPSIAAIRMPSLQPDTQLQLLSVPVNMLLSY